MTNLFAFSLCGKTLYFSGSIPENKFEDVERVANNITGNLSSDEYAKRLVEHVFRELKIKLKFCPIVYVFRVRKNDGYRAN